MQKWALVLAAGKGTRFKSSRPKVLHKVCGKPMVEHVLDRLEELDFDRILVVVGHAAEKIRKALSHRRVEFVHQEPQLGTGHAVLMAAPLLQGVEGQLVVVYADTPRISAATLRSLLDCQTETGADQVLLTCELPNPAGYGRILRDPSGKLERIVEERDASPEQRRIQEVNPGFYAFRIPSLLEGLQSLDSNNAQGEYYLTDLVQAFRESGKQVESVFTPCPEEVVGINDRAAMAATDTALRDQINRGHMLAGVTILRPETVTIDETVEIGSDTKIYPGVVLEGRTRIGKGCRIGPWSYLKDAVLGQEVQVDASSVIRASQVGDKTTIGPFAHLRQEVKVGRSARVGNFVEIKKSTLGDGAKSAHLAYLGDSQIGDRVNVGAGVITCNYDGFKKHRTIIEAGAFIGSDSQLVAPVRVGEGAYIASGSTITEDVPADALAIARTRQVNKKGWAKEKRKEKGQESKGKSQK